jgi:predicted ATPase/CYTH domain-containing protein
MTLNIITGGPGTGKTTLLEALREKGFSYIPEVARYLVDQGHDKSDPSFQEKVVSTQVQWEKKSTAKFADRSLIDGIGYCNHFGLALPRNLPTDLKNRYSRVFILDPLPNYVNDSVRSESLEEAKAIHQSIIQAYTDLGYNPIFVPAVGIEERVNFVLKELETEKERKFLLYENGKWYCTPIPLAGGIPIRQGYLEEVPPGFTQARIRQIGGLYFFTKKDGNGYKRREIEETISKEEFERLWPKTTGRRVLKERFLWNGFEVDRYRDRELIIAEAEARSIKIGTEVTENGAYSNCALAK